MPEPINHEDIRVGDRIRVVTTHLDCGDVSTREFDVKAMSDAQIFGSMMGVRRKASRCTERSWFLVNRRTPVIDIVFDGPPSHEAGRFVEVEDENGRSIRVGQWVHRPDGLWALRIPRDEFSS